MMLRPDAVNYSDARRRAIRFNGHSPSRCQLYLRLYRYNVVQEPTRPKLGSNRARFGAVSASAPRSTRRRCGAAGGARSRYVQKPVSNHFAALRYTRCALTAGSPLALRRFDEYPLFTLHISAPNCRPIRGQGVLLHELMARRGPAAGAGHYADQLCAHTSLRDGDRGIARPQNRSMYGQYRRVKPTSAVPTSTRSTWWPAPGCWKTPG